MIQQPAPQALGNVLREDLPISLDETSVICAKEDAAEEARLAGSGGGVEETRGEGVEGWGESVW